MARPKGSTREKVLMRDAYKASLLATAERAISGDQKAQEVFLSAISVPAHSHPGLETKNAILNWS